MGGITSASMIDSQSDISVESVIKTNDDSWQSESESTGMKGEQYEMNS